MEVGQTKLLCSNNDDSVGIRDIETRLNDSCRDEHIVVVIGKAQHDVLELLRRHLSVSDGNAGIRNALVQHVGQFRQSTYAIAHKEHLSVATHLEVHGFGYHFGGEHVQFRLDGIAVGWRCLDDTEVASPHETELQGARNGGSRQRKRIDIGTHLAQFLLRGNTELLLFVDDE